MIAKLNYNMSTQDFPSSIIIPGIDSAAGLALYGGEIDLYLSALRSFVPNAISVIEKMRIVSQESLTDYTINVHGLKSISSNIGAEQLRTEAMLLEMKAKSGDLEEILTRNNALLKDAEDLISNVQAWLAELDTQNPKPLLERPDPLLLIRLQKSCETYDMDGIDQAMDKLESACYDNDASLITWLREKITELDFSSAAERLSVYLADHKEASHG